GMNRPVVSDTALYDMARRPGGALFYEMAMLMECARRFHELMDKRGSASTYDLEFNMTIESFLIHYRILQDFLYPTDKVWNSIDDCVAFDFNPNWVDRKKYWTDERKQERKRINK